MKTKKMKMMKNSTILGLMMLVTFTATSQWTLDKGHSKFAFIATHHGISEVDGYFKDFSGTITASKDDLSDAEFEVTIASASIFTDLEMRDNHLKSPDMFDIESQPQIMFKSTSFQKIEGNKYTMVGDLTIKGVTRSIKLDVTMKGPVANPNPRSDALQIGLKATTTVNRSDFKIGEELQNIMVSDEIQLRFTGEYNKGE